MLKMTSLVLFLVKVKVSCTSVNSCCWPLLVALYDMRVPPFPVRTVGDGYHKEVLLRFLSKPGNHTGMVIKTLRYMCRAGTSSER